MSKKVLFMGTPSYATEILKELLNNKNYEVIGIFTQEDKPVGRKQLLTPPHIKQYCLENNINIPILQPKKLKDNLVAYISIKELEPDFIVVAAYGQILPKEILGAVAISTPCDLRSASQSLDERKNWFFKDLFFKKIPIQ